MAPPTESLDVARRRRDVGSARRRLTEPFVGDRSQALLFLAPLVAVLALFLAWPLVDAFRLSLTRWNGFDPPEPVGLDNFRMLADDPVFRQAVKNNLLALLAVPFWVLGPYLLACLI